MIHESRLFGFARPRLSGMLCPEVKRVDEQIARGECLSSGVVPDLTRPGTKAALGVFFTRLASANPTRTDASGAVTLRFAPLTLGSPGGGRSARVLPRNGQLACGYGSSLASAAENSPAASRPTALFRELPTLSPRLLSNPRPVRSSRPGRGFRFWRRRWRGPHGCFVPLTPIPRGANPVAATP